MWLIIKANKFPKSSEIIKDRKKGMPILSVYFQSFVHYSTD
jgi:hypothetical protein